MLSILFFKFFFKVCRADWPSERNAKKPHKSVPQSGIKTSGVFLTNLLLGLIVISCPATTGWAYTHILLTIYYLLLTTYHKAVRRRTSEFIRSIQALSVAWAASVSSSV